MLDYSQNTKLLAISPMLFDLQASYLEYMYKTVRDSVNSDLVKRSRSQIKVKRFGFSGAVFIESWPRFSTYRLLYQLQSQVHHTRLVTVIFIQGGLI